MALNVTILMGRLTKDVETKTVGDNIKVADFTLAVNRRFKSKNPDAPTADYIPVQVWRNQAEFAEKYFTKGKQVYVRGSLETYSWDREDGTKAYGFRVKAEDIGFADTLKSEGKKEDGTNNSIDNMGYIPSAPDFQGDDLPF